MQGFRLLKKMAICGVAAGSSNLRVQGVRFSLELLLLLGISPFLNTLFRLSLFRAMQDGHDLSGVVRDGRLALGRELHLRGPRRWPGRRGSSRIRPGS